VSDFEEQKLELRKEILQGLGLDPEYFLGDTQYSGTAAALALQDSLVQKRRQRIAAHIQCTHGIRVRFVNAISAKLQSYTGRAASQSTLSEMAEAAHEAALGFAEEEPETRTFVPELDIRPDEFDRAKLHVSVVRCACGRCNPTGEKV